MDEGTGDGDALSFAARESIGAMVETSAETDGSEHHRRPLAGFAARRAVDPERVLDVLERGQDRHQVELLEDEAEPSSPEEGALALGERCDVALLERESAGVGAVDRAEQMKKRRLAASRRAGDDQRLAGGDVEVDAVERPHFAPADQVSAGEPAGREEGRVRHPSILSAKLAAGGSGCRLESRPRSRELHCRSPHAWGRSMTGGFPCRRCGARIPVPPEALRDATASLVCLSCGQRYARKGGGTLAGGPVQPAVAPAGPAGPATRLEGPLAIAAAPAVAPHPTPAEIAQAPTRAYPGVLSTRERLATFDAGDTVAQRYRIVRFIAQGGMGEVYEAEDLELHGRVALKTVRATVATEQGAVERFKREIQLARAVTHPNVCRIFDVGYHDLERGEPPIVFLTMELLAGETLAARLRQVGSLSLAEALPIVVQLGAALAAAHAAGVIHRDFKSENVFLVAGKDGERAVVTDFGIARGGDDRFGAQLTSTGNVIGTPAYMAPEQISGGPITPKVDQYALGIVLFELVTGEQPFRGDNPLATAARRLTEAPPSPRHFLPDIDPVWEETILRCLERDPDLRFPDVLAVARALTGEERVRPHEPTPTVLPAERRKRRLAALLALLLVGAAIWAVVRIRAIGSRLEAGAPITARRSVAVLSLKNLAGRADAAWLATALAEMLSTELALGEELRVISGEGVTRALADLGLTGTDVIDSGARLKLRRRLGADYLVVGAYTILPDGAALRLDLRLEDARSNEKLTTVVENGPVAQLFELVARSGVGLRRALGAEAKASGVRPALPASPEAARLYSEGLDALRSFEPQRARELLERAVVADPNNALARSALATAWTALGYPVKAEKEAREARDRATGLPMEERLVVDARYFETAGQWIEAAAIWEKLWSVYPDTGAYGLRLAACSNLAGQPDRALAATLALRNLPPPENENPRIDLMEANAAGALSDFRRQADAAARAAERAEADGAKLLAAEALVVRGWALRNLGRAPEARAAVERSRALYDAAGDRAGVSAADAALGGVLLDLGEPDNARAAYELALATARDLGDRGSESRALNNLAVLARSRGELESARASYERVEAISAETGERMGAAFAANNLVAILVELGELTEAERRAEQALAVWREAGDKSGLASALGNLGTVRRRQGRLVEAESAATESLELRRAIGQRPGEAVALNGLAQVRFERGDLDGAAQRFGDAAILARELSAKSALAAALVGQAEIAATRNDNARALALLSEALALRRELGERAGSARVRAAIARLDLASNPGAAATTARELLAAPAAERTPEIEAAARIVLARALQAMRELTPARDALAAPELVLRLSFMQALEWRLTEARFATVAIKRSEARAVAAAVGAEANAAGAVGAELEAALLEAELGGGDREEVARRSRAAGFEALALRAEAPPPG